MRSRVPQLHGRCNLIALEGAEHRPQVRTATVRPAVMAPVARAAVPWGWLVNVEV